MPATNYVLILSFLVCMTLGVTEGQIRAFTTESPECRRKCNNCPPTPTCAYGVSLIPGKCGCCKQCARQLDETCNDDMKCDPHRNLYCSYSGVDEHEGVCVAKPGRACLSSGLTYLNGESFLIGCKVKCTCMDGVLACENTCPLTITARAPKNCRHPQLVKKPNQCCSEWICSGETLSNNNTTNTRPSSSHSQIRRRHPNTFRPRVIAMAANRRTPISITVRAKDKCNVQTTEWSACSKTCGWGVSERVTNDNKACKLRKQSRLCQIRPCSSSFVDNIKRGKKCIRTVKAQRRVQYSFSGCQSKVYTPKYCGACTDGRCCAPKHTVTKPIKFTCDGGFQFKKRMMVIKSCSCSRRCVGENSFFSYRRMGGDTWQE
uniref:connective tissue growth factor isoform X1 n=1 Tax=Ciona intestinalis TaxID=7719 RepID=UPI000180B9E3|nr:connective tissue growth factor isoform X1 [Ciona intestinalis]|eukprot:XP_002127157.1 connective tissue growth factor isoform X1 [Ciona intestinalis]